MISASGETPRRFAALGNAHQDSDCSLPSTGGLNHSDHLISKGEISSNGRTTIIAPLLPGHKTYPFVVNVNPTAKNGLRGQRHINLSQLRVVDALRVKNKQGVLEDFYWSSIEKAIQIEFGFGQTFDGIV